MSAAAPPADRPTLAAADVAAVLHRAVELAADLDSPEEALETCVELVCELTGWPLGHVVLPLPPDGGDLGDGERREDERRDERGGDDGRWRDSNIWHVDAGAAGAADWSDSLDAALDAAEPGPLPGGSGPDAPTAAGRALAVGGPVWARLAPPDANDADGAGGEEEESHPAGPLRAGLAAAGLRAAFAFPIAVEGTTAAVCEFFTPRPPPAAADGDDGAVDPQLKAVVTGLAGQVGAVLRRVRDAIALEAREAALDDLFETAAVGLLLLAPDGTVRRANRAFRQVLGVPGVSGVSGAGDALVGRPVSAWLAEGGRGGGPLLAAARSGRPLLGHETDFRTATGAVRTLLIDANANAARSPRRRSAGSARRGVRQRGPRAGELPDRPPAEPVLRCFTRDVTARRRGEEERNRLAEIVRATPDSVVSKSLDGRIQTWNAGAQAVYGYAAADAIGKTAVELGIVPRERAEEDARLMRMAAAGRRVEQFHTKRVTRAGVRIDVSLTVGPIRDAAGRVIGAAFVARDDTDRRRAAEKLEQATGRAERASRAKTEFLANVSHELRTPMSAIIGLTDLALDEPLPPHVSEWLGTVRESADHLLALLNEILDFSRIESRRFELEPGPFALRDVVEDTVKSLARKADEKGLELTGSVAGGLPDRLIGDPVRLRQILTNLIGNAVKFTEAGGVSVRVEPDGGGADHGGGGGFDDGDRVGEEVGVRIAVRDTGPGIAADDRERVFQPFAQADNTTARKHGGTGLGLSIVRKLVELMGGSLTLDSATAAELARRPPDSPGGGDGGDRTEPGTTIEVRLRLPAAAGPAVAAAVPELRGLPVLVADASAENRRLLVEALESWQMRPVAAASAAEARELVAAAAGRGAAFPLVLADAALAGLSPGDGDADADAAAGLVGAAAEAGGAGVVLVTASDRRRRRTELDAPGVAGAVEKPIARSELLDTIVAALGADPVLGDRGDGGATDRPAGRRSVTRAAGAARLRVLLVEDTAANRKVLTAVLGKRGHDVTVAVNGRAGVEAFEQSLKDPRSRLDAVLMDVQMPVLDGLRATAELRRIEAARGLPRTPVLALTAHALRGDRERCLEAGMDGYLSKPIDVHELIGALESHARRGRRARRQTPPAAMTPAVTSSPPPPDPPPVPQEERSSGGPAVFDRSAATARMGGDAGLLAEVAGLFAEDAPPLCATYATSVAGGDAESARVAAHTLKGICATVGGDAAQAAARRAELAASSHVDAALAAGRDPAALPPGDLADLEPLGEALTAAVRTLTDTLGAAFEGS